MRPRYDHAVIFAHDLDRAGASWREMGFTTSPRMYHPAEAGSMNELIMLQSNYIELLGVANATPATDHYQSLAGGNDGVIMQAVASFDCAADAAAIERRGGEVLAPDQTIRRKVPLPDGSEGEVAYRGWMALYHEAPRLALFGCEHFAPEHLWVPQWQEHPNGAQRIVETIFVVDAPERHVEYFEQVLGSGCAAPIDGGFEVRLGDTQCNEASLLRVLSQNTFDKHYPVRSLPMELNSTNKCVALTIEATSLDKVGTALTGFGSDQVIIGDDEIWVLPKVASGVSVKFVAEVETP